MPAPCLVTVGTDVSMLAAARGLPPSAPLSLGLGPGTRDSGSATGLVGASDQGCPAGKPAGPSPRPSVDVRDQRSHCQQGEGVCLGLSLKTTAAGGRRREHVPVLKCGQWPVTLGRTPVLPTRRNCLGEGESDGAALGSGPCSARPGRATPAMRHSPVSQLCLRCVNEVAAVGYSEDSMARFRSNAPAAWHVPGVKGMKDDRRCCSPQEGKSAGVFWGGLLRA